MTRDEFLEMISECTRGWPPSAAVRAVFREANRIFDPLLEDDDEKQIRFAAKEFSRRGEEFFNIADALDELLR